MPVLSAGITDMKQAIIGAGFSLLGRTGLHRLAPAGLRGIGAILMFHHVRPRREDAYRPNGLLEITPEFLDAVILRLRHRGYEIVTMDEAALRCRQGADSPQKPFAVLTFDDGYRDNLDHALPVLDRHEAPFTMFVTPGFADRSARLWWIELEEAVRRLDAVDVTIGDDHVTMPAGTAKEKQAAFTAVYTRIRAGSEVQLLTVVGQLCADAGVGSRQLTASSCMEWTQIVRLSRHRLATIGAHTMTHPRLAKLDRADMLAEMESSRAEIENRIGRSVTHFAYPVGDPTSAGPREFEAARQLGFASAVTTRPGLVFPDHADHVTALPRLSVNGDWQDLKNIEVLLSGAAFALWNRGRRVNAA